MLKAKTFLFISIDGMTDSLGQSQVLPYMIGLAKNGHQIGIVSCEKKEQWDIHHLVIEALVKEAGITWNYCFYKKRIPFISQIQNFFALKNIVSNLLTDNTSKDITLHCRSYLAGLIGLSFKKKKKTGFIFDMRGFWADERVEGGIWNKKNLIGAYLYSYFKKKEKEMLQHSDAIISLTHQAKKIILSWDLGFEASKITVIPCCADLSHFSKENLEPQHLENLKNRFPQLKNKFVLSYVGSLGTWYMADEMLDFFKLLLDKKDCHFLVITKDSDTIIHQAAKRHHVSLNNLTVVSASRSDMPYYISLSDASLFFIRPTFSKSASSPTKMGELLSMGIPVITNAGIGDVDSIIENSICGVMIHDFNKKNYQNAVSDLLENSKLHESNTVKAAKDYFSLHDGIEKYAKVYNSFF